MSGIGLPLTLADGTPVLLRPVLTSDLDGIRRGFREMSRTSRYLRFFTAGEEMSESQARYFTEIDQHNHVAWCAVEPMRGQRGYGIVRFIRTAEPEIADFAIAVIDEMQGRGLGSLLLATLYLLAQVHGVRELRGEVLQENLLMPQWLFPLGAFMAEGSDDSYGILTWPIRPDEAPPAPTAEAERFAGRVARLRPLILPLVPRQPRSPG